MEAKLKGAVYQFTDGGLKITMEINFEMGVYTLHTNTQALDFCFLDSDPEVSKPILSLMLAATEYARAALNDHEQGIHASGAYTSTVKTRVEISAIYPKPVKQ